MRLSVLVPAALPEVLACLVDQQRRSMWDADAARSAVIEEMPLLALTPTSAEAAAAAGGSAEAARLRASLLSTGLARVAAAAATAQAAPGPDSASSSRAAQSAASSLRAAGRDSPARVSTATPVSPHGRGKLLAGFAIVDDYFSAAHEGVRAGPETDVAPAGGSGEQAASPTVSAPGAVTEDKVSAAAPLAEAHQRAADPLPLPAAAHSPPLAAAVPRVLSRTRALLSPQSLLANAAATFGLADAAGAGPGPAAAAPAAPRDVVLLQFGLPERSAPTAEGQRGAADAAGAASSYVLVEVSVVHARAQAVTGRVRGVVLVDAFRLSPERTPATGAAAAAWTRVERLVQRQRGWELGWGAEGDAPVILAPPFVLPPPPPAISTPYLVPATYALMLLAAAPLARLRDLFVAPSAQATAPAVSLLPPPPLWPTRPRVQSRALDVLAARAAGDPLRATAAIVAAASAAAEGGEAGGSPAAEEEAQASVLFEGIAYDADEGGLAAGEAEAGGGEEPGAPAITGDIAEGVGPGAAPGAEAGGVEIAPSPAMPTVSEGAARIGLGDFDLLGVIGRGGYGAVLAVRRVAPADGPPPADAGRLYALKVLTKVSVVRSHAAALSAAPEPPAGSAVTGTAAGVAAGAAAGAPAAAAPAPAASVLPRKATPSRRAMTERNILASVSSHPFLVGLQYAFQTREHLFLVTQLCSGGDLYTHLQRRGPAALPRAVLYAAELVLALEHLHAKGVVYRDLKPENVLLSEEGHVRLTDFGLSRLDDPLPAAAVSATTLAAGGGGGGGGDGGGGDGTRQPRAVSFCGTESFMSPEALLQTGAGVASDWWSLGILLCEVMLGEHPFRGPTHIDTLRNIARPSTLPAGLE